MEHSIEEYLRQLPTTALEKFLQDYRNDKFEEDFSYVIKFIEQELARQKGEKEQRIKR